jgi:hypothetical protein
MKKIYILFFCLTTLWAEENTVLKGKLTNENLDVYQVAILKPNGVLFRGSVFYEKEFHIEFDNPEDIILKITAFGFDDFIQNIKANEFNKPFVITLQSLSLAEVRIEIEAPKLSIEEGNMTVDVSASPMLSLSGTAEDVLNKIPKLKMREGKVEIAGKGKVALLLNGIPTSVDIISQIPSDEIKKVEIIENPSAKYAAVASGGSAINIITKNEISAKGTTFRSDIYADALTYWSAAVRANITHTFNPIWRVALGYRYNPKKKLRADSLEFQNLASGTYRNVYTKTILEDYGHQVARLKIDFTPHKKHTFELGYQMVYRDFHRYNKTTEYTGNQDQSSDETQTVERWAHNVTFNYKVKFDTAVDHSLQFNFSYSPVMMDDNRNTLQTIFQTPPTESQTLRDYRNIKNPLYFQIDYRYPITKYQLFPEIGINYLYSQERNTVDVIRGSFINPVNSTQEHTISSYAQLGHQIKQFYYQIGISVDRIERYFSWEANLFYWNYIPRLKMTYNFDSKNNVVLSYARMIQQPSVDELSNQLNYSSNSNIYSTGNPNLKQSEAHVVQGNYSWSNLLFFAGKYQYTRNPWFSLITQDGNDYVESPINIDQTQWFTLGLTVPYEYKIWSMQYVLNWDNQWVDLSGFGTDTNVPYWVPSFYFYTSQEVNLQRNFTLSLNYAYQSNAYQNIVKTLDTHTLTVMVAKKWKKTYTLSLEFEDILRQSVRTETYNFPLITNRQTYTDTRRIRLRFAVMLSNVKTKEERGKKI